MEEALLERAHLQITRLACSLWRAPEPHAKDDPTPVPAGTIARLEGFAQSLGYPVHYRPCVGGRPGTLGHTMREYDPLTHRQEHRFDAIELRDDMSPASTLRVMCHELGHAMHEVPFYSAREASAVAEGSDELLAESVAGLVGSQLGTSSGYFTAQYLCNYGAEPGALARVRPEAVQSAARILAALR